MNITRSEPITIQDVAQRRQTGHLSSSPPSQRIPRQRHDTITRIKDSFGQSQKNGLFVSPHLSSPTPPTFVPDGSHQASRIGDYLLVEQVEGHNYGNVFRAVNCISEHEFICKVYNKTEYRKSLEPYSRMEPHQNINHVVDLIIGENNAYLFFQPGVPQENKQCNGINRKSGFTADNLHNFIRMQKQLSEEVAAPLFTQVAEAVSHCHENDIVIRDLKLRKFIFRNQDRTQVMLESLEDACILQSEDEGMTVKNGCLAYISPEILAFSAAALSSSNQTKNNSASGSRGKSSDVWSMGVMLYTMLVGRYPFQESEPSALFSKISRGHFEVPDSLSSEARDLIHNLLRRDPAQRFRASDILLHPWVKKKGKCWDAPRFVMPLGSGGDSRLPRDPVTSHRYFQMVTSSRNLLASFGCSYVDQVVPDSYVSQEDETMFE